MKLTRLFYSLFLLGVFWALTTAIALAWPEDAPDKATISGPGLKGEVEVTDKDILAVLSLGAIEDFEHGPITTPEVGEGYQISRYFYDASFNFGRLRYYPNPAGERGYVFFEDGPDFVGDHTAYNHKWFYATPQGDAAMHSLLKSLGALTPEPKLTVAINNETSAALPAKNFWWPALGVIIFAVCALALAGGLIFLRR
jgi:hypothetical protein